MRLNQIKLTNFRNIKTAEIDFPAEKNIVVLYGKNGAGKTSVLEAISLLSPGFGLNGETFSSMISKTGKSFTVFYQSELKDDDFKTGMQFDGKRTIKINSEALKSQTELTKLGSVIWFSPKFDRLFYDNPTARRKFIDRMIFGLDKTYAKTLQEYTFHLKSRQKLLKERADNDWLDIEEAKIADLGLKILQTRLGFISKLNSKLKNITLSANSRAERLLEKLALDEFKTEYLKLLKNSREADLKQNSCAFGPHRTDISGILKLENSEIELEKSSLGQHKKAVIAIILANIELIKEESGFTPILLMDEVFSHLDSEARKRLAKHLEDLGVKTFLSGTDKELFLDFVNPCFIRVNSGNFELNIKS